MLRLYGYFYCRGPLMSGIDVFVGNYPVIDWELYTLWVEGED